MTQLTVSQLIEQLQKLPQDAPVLTEGCDCIGPCSGTSLGYKRNRNCDGAVVLLRDDDHDDEAINAGSYK